MRTRNSNFPNNSNVIIPRRRNKKRIPNIDEPEIPATIIPIVTMADNRTMEELLRAPTEVYGEVIVLPEINADHFEIKTNLLQLVQANPFHGLENENPHAQINSFKRITSTLRFRNVPNDVIKLMMFPYSLEGAAKTWYEKEPPNSILTWDDLVTKFVNQFFPPSKTTHLKNKISRFSQEFDESFCEAWERFKGMLRACPHHGFTELTQVDTFYNGLNENEQDSLNATAGGNLLSKTTREALNIIENKSKVRYSRNKSNISRMNATSSKTDERIDKLADQLSTLAEIVSKKVVVPPAPVKAVEESCITCGGAHSWYNCPSTDNNQPSVCATMGTYNQVAPPNRVSNQMAPPGFAPVQNNGQNRNQATNQMEKFFQTFQDLHFDISFADALFFMPRFAPRIKSLLMNKDKLIELAKISVSENCSAMLLKKLSEKLGDPDKFIIPCDFLGMDVCHALADLDGSINLMPFSIWRNFSLPKLTPIGDVELADFDRLLIITGVAKNVLFDMEKFHFPTDFVVIDFEADPRVLLILGRSFLRTGHALIDFVRSEVEYFDSGDNIDEIDVFLAMEVSTNFKCPLHMKFTVIAFTASRIVRENEEILVVMVMQCGNHFPITRKNYHASPSTIIESLPTFPIPIEDSDSLREEIDMLAGLDDLIPPVHFHDPSSPRPSPELPDVEICFNFEPDTAVKNNFDVLNKDDYFDPRGGVIDVLSPNVEDDDSFIIVIQIFLPFLTYPEDSPLLLSIRSEDTIFDPRISAYIFFSYKPVAFHFP
ncbi:reverse transcriptase domain-containing protein [Tanacetum coccineum]